MSEFSDNLPQKHPYKFRLNSDDCLKISSKDLP